ncbi:hypothetical protein F5883DRAFT_595779 [Diaporthe sp. PMI_573]|nr:hypothetical protein F5883DRAFT_595779 [Diaporthaceae sp. PMI_573]
MSVSLYVYLFSPGSWWPIVAHECPIDVPMGTSLLGGWVLGPNPGLGQVINRRIDSCRSPGRCAGLVGFVLLSKPTVGPISVRVVTKILVVLNSS